MRSGWLLIPTGVFVAFGAVAVARLWPTRTSRLVVFGVTGFGVLVVTCQGLGVLAAVLRQPVVQPLWILVGSGAVALVCWRVAGLLRGRDLSWGDDDFPGGARALSGARLRDRVPALTVVAVALAVLSHSIVLGLSAPPRGWDVLAYHMPRALSWLQQGNLGNYGSIAAFYPGNGEIAILLSLFTGTDRLAPLVQLPFALLGGAALCGLARELGASARAAAVPAIVFFASPMVLFGSALAKNDLMVIGLVLG
ncbi:MAG: hypothetical protein KAW67_01285, partial [Candidatus Eisenbacteria sp.]|nr:hypothetical protein [Candidatus Eisenbacteria bacterium]